MILRDYQRSAVTEALAAIGAGKRPILQAPTGSGKSLIGAELCRAVIEQHGDAPTTALSITHTRELISQNAACFERYTGASGTPIPHGIYSAGLGQKDLERPMTFAGVQSYCRVTDPPHPQMILVDECFTAGTLVNGRPIETFAPGDSVTSFNHATGAVETDRVLAVLTHNVRVDSLCRLSTSDGAVIECTRSHTFWNGEAYVRADRLLGSHLSCLRTPHRRHARKAAKPKRRETDPLFGSLCPADGFHTSPQNGSSESRENEHCKSNAGPGSPSPGFGETSCHGPHAENTRWEWQGPDRSGENATRSHGRSLGGKPHSRHTCPERARYPDTLQTGPCAPGPAHSRRGGRSIASSSVCKKEGRQENCILDSARVDGIAFPKFGREGTVTVYNLHVERNNNYFADGYLAHNCHRIPSASESQYGQVLTSANGAARCGLTATPYRLDSGLLTEGENAWFDTLIPVATTAELQSRGVLSPLTGVISRAQVDIRGVHTRAGEFVLGELEQVATEEACVNAVCSAILHHAASRASILVFAVSVAHAVALSARLAELGCPSGYVSGDMPIEQRDATLAAFRSGALRALCNCMILTTGYDYPGIDCIACVRPTQSMSLWVQMVGRGLRVTEGKPDCQILDFGGNWARHGRSLDGLPDDAVLDEPAADERDRKSKAEAEARKYRFRLDQDSADSRADVVETRVRGIRAYAEPSRRMPHLRQVRVTYRTDMGGITIWLLPEHPDRIRRYSAPWFDRRGLRMPASAPAAMTLAMAAPVPESISVVRDGDFWRVLVEHFAW